MAMRNLPNLETRKAAIANLSFSPLSNIVLEIRQAIIEKVHESIPIHQPLNQMYFLLGETGKGKSTAFCFLRGDEMVLKDSHYESKSDKSGMIGHSSVSCTFFPTVECVGDLVFVDFPGFDDTNGPLICLAAELALKALIQNYHPKFLILESVTVEDRFAMTARLASRLDRLLANKRSSCVVGFTKYSRNADFCQLRHLKELQRVKLESPTEEELRLMGGISALSALGNNPALQTLKEELALLQQQRKNRRLEPVPETKEQIELSLKIQQQETEILREIDVDPVNFIRFSDLEDEKRLSECLERLPALSLAPVQLGPNRLDPDDRRFLDERFEKDLRRTLERLGESEYDPGDANSFIQSVLSTGLIYTITRTLPEVRRFLHLPEMDPENGRSIQQRHCWLVLWELHGVRNRGSQSLVYSN